MPVVVVANPKGGVGKSTVATHIAGYFASRGHSVMLGDADRQQSSRLWLRLRPPEARSITGWEVGEGQIAKPPKGTTHVVLDTPAGIHGKMLQEAIALTVFVPFAVLYMKQPVKLDFLWAGLCIMGAMYFMFRGTTGA